MQDDETPASAATDPGCGQTPERFDMPEFTCPDCGIAKPASEYNKNAARSRGYDSVCRACAKVRRKAIEQRNKTAEAPTHLRCTVDGCESRRKGHGYCVKHLHRFREYGDPLGGPIFRKRTTGVPFRPKGMLSPEEVFLHFMPGEPPPEGVPWLWPASQDANGYGHFTFKRKRYYAHRVSYEMFVGPIPDGLLIRHKNDVPLDINPHNLETGTLADNRQDCVDRGRAIGPRGERQHLAKLTREQVDEVIRRNRSGERQKALADEFGVSPTAIWKIVHRVNWNYD